MLLQRAIQSLSLLISKSKAAESFLRFQRFVLSILFLMATVGTAVAAAAVVSAGMSLTVVMVVVVALGFGVIV